MKVIDIIIAHILCGLCFLLVSCDKSPTQSGSPYGTIALANNLVVIDNIEGIELYGINSQNGVYTFQIEDNYNTIVVGDIIVGTASGGYIRRVTGQVRDRKILELQTEDANLSDVIKRGGTDTTLYLSIGSAQKKSNVELISAAKGVSVFAQGINLSGISLFSGVTEGVKVDVKIVDGSISFDPKVEYGFGMSSSGLSHYHTFVSGALNYDYNLEIAANGKFGMTGLKNIAELRHTSIQMFGILPLLEVVTLKVDIGFVISAAIDGTFACGAKAAYDVNAGAQFDKEKISKRWTHEKSFEEQPISWPSRSEKHIRTYVQSKVTVSYFSVTSSQVSLKSYADYDAAVSNYPSWCWEANNGIEGAYGVQFSLFDNNLPFHAEDFDPVEWIIASDCENVEDNTAPSEVDDLFAGEITSNSIRLTWTSTGDDAKIGKATEYEIRYSKSPIDLSNWSLAKKCSPTPNPQNAINAEQYVVTGLSPETDYYFALKVADEIPNWSAMSNVTMATTGEIEDVIRPSAISDLFSGSPTAHSMTLTWTAPGDDGYSGRATKYDIRYSTNYITPYTWYSHPALPNSLTPRASGSDEEFIVTNLVPNTIYYFAIKSADEVNNWSDISNMAGERTAMESERGNIIDEFSSPVSSYTLDMAGTDSSLWIINQTGDTVYNVDLSDGSLNNKVNFSLDDNTNLRGITFDGTYLWLAASSDIYKIDPGNGNQLGHFRYNQTIESVSGLTWGNGKLWLAGPLVNKVYEVDTDRAILDGHSDSSITNQIIFSNSPSFRGILYFQDGLFISSRTNSETATVWEFDPSTGEIRQEFQISESDPRHNPIQGGLATDGTYLYVGGDNLRILKIRY